jgi:hypothetical protein
MNRKTQIHNRLSTQWRTLSLEQLHHGNQPAHYEYMNHFATLCCIQYSDISKQIKVEYSGLLLVEND